MVIKEGLNNKEIILKMNLSHIKSKNDNMSKSNIEIIII